MLPQNSRLVLAVVAIALLVIVAATVSYFISSRMGAGTGCADKGCSSSLGMSLGLLWIGVAVGAVTIWNRCK
jgi:hypothetical protein